MVVAGSLAAYGKDLLSDTSRIQSLTGMKGAWNAKEGVFKVSSPRTDLPVSVDGFAMPPFMGLTTWVGFFDGGKAEAMIMGDLVLFQDEVDPVLDALLASGVQVTALHNHFFYDNPKVYFMHVSGDDSLARLAGGVGKAMEAVKSIRKAHAALPLAFEGPAIGSPSAITPKPLEAVFGQEGEKKDGMIKFIFGRKTRMPCGCEAGKGMGVNTWAAFAGKDEAALVDGDFAMREEEIQGVLKALRQAGIHIVAIHQHMIEEKPRILFLHYWGKGKAAELAQGIRSALATQAKD
ncbi:MAG: DUF1259 domain-containing protein [Fibrobacteres bacterium]|nr:DUF1259 domain-containing protein [Fibrobacterota bacterium]